MPIKTIFSPKPRKPGEQMKIQTPTGVVSGVVVREVPPREATIVKHDSTVKVNVAKDYYEVRIPD